MAIFHLHLEPVRKAGSTLARSAHHTGTRLTRGATGKAAYLSAERLIGVDGKAVDYRSKHEVEYSQLIFPGGGTGDREKFWNSVDAHKTQKETAIVARDTIVALPHELGETARRDAASEFGRWISDKYGVAVDLAIHRPEVDKGSDSRNYHMHILISDRFVSPTGELGNVNRALNAIHCRQVDHSRGRTERTEVAVATMRRAWERIANAALERAGSTERVRHVSLRARGVDREPNKHLGRAETQRRRDASRHHRQHGRDTKSPDHLRREIRDATRRIEGIQARRRAEFVPEISPRVGTLEEWENDAAGAFKRAWKSADRASAVRKSLRERDAMRPATIDEERELRSAGRARSRATKQLKEVRTPAVTLEDTLSHARSTRSTDGRSGIGR